MNNRFTVPIAVAVAVHATLLFGFRKPSPVTKCPVTKSVSTVPAIEIREIEEPKPIEEKEAGQKGSPEAYRQTLDDVPRPLKPHDIPIESAPPEPPSIMVRSRIDPLPPGSERGVEGGIRIDRDGIVSVSGLDNPPNARVRVSPDYPFGPRNEGLEGEVMVQFIVDERGFVVNPFVVSSTDRRFEESSLRAVSKWRFEPGKHGGRVVRFRMSVPLVFRLGES